MQRRDFITLSSTGTLLIWSKWHDYFTNVSRLPIIEETGIPRIMDLQLLTSSAISAMKTFYKDIIGLPITYESSDRLSILAGKTRISFVKIQGPGPEPFYHFAFNIPENKIRYAFEWQKKRTPLINPFPENPTDPMKELIEFPNWNAQSVFFLDPSGNLVEYIARHNLKNSSTGEFSQEDILYASEIGLIAEDISSAGNILLSKLSLHEYRPAFPGFWPIGDEYGLLLLFEKGRIWSLHKNKETKTDIFKTKITLRTGNKQGWKLLDYPYEIYTS